jgi:uncharacterized protein with ParB-like and HNH nuclease domain
MKSDGKDTLNTYFGSTTHQYVIPFFQRAYVWTEENWSNFWDSIEEEFHCYQAEIKSEHFIGTIITRDTSGSWRKTPKAIELVDGQQRITTVALLLKAIADRAVTDSMRDYVNNLLFLKDKLGTPHYRVKHSEVDRTYFGGLLDGEDFSKVQDGTSNILDAYRFFHLKLEGVTTEEIGTLVEVILGNLPVISIELDERDDEQEIFDTINSLGVRLTIGELLKNFVFREPNLRPLYEKTWQATFEADEETIKFWDTTKTAGRVKRTNLELLLYCFLIVETGEEVRLEKLYKEYKKYLNVKSTVEKSTFLKNLCEYAEDYRKFPTTEELDQVTVEDREKRLFHVVENLEITTIYPLLLLLYRKVDDRKERESCCSLLESYLIRRLICGLTTKNYNRVFLSWIAKLKTGKIVNASALESVVQSGDKNTNRMPKDEEINKGFQTTFLYNKNAREVLFMLALSQLQANSRQDVNKKLLSVNAYSVEHIMPKKWKEYWKDSGMSEKNKEDRNWYLKRLGNLTLITGTMNSSIRNRGWKTKRKKLSGYSDLPITKDYLELETWDEEEISKRAGDLAALAVSLW